MASGCTTPWRGRATRWWRGAGRRPARPHAHRGRHARPGAAAARAGRRVITVVFACVHNAGRSQMAAALFNRVADPARARAISAGTLARRAGPSRSRDRDDRGRRRPDGHRTPAADRGPRPRCGVADHHGLRRPVPLRRRRARRGLATSRSEGTARSTEVRAIRDDIARRVADWSRARDGREMLERCLVTRSIDRSPGRSTDTSPYRSHISPYRDHNCPPT